MKQRLLFDQDIFLKTDFPVALDSPDHIDPHGGTQQDYTDGTSFAKYLAKHFPDKKTIIDLGTATGTVPLTMCKFGMNAVGLEGSDASKKRGIGAWGEAPGIVRTCDISRPFSIVDKIGKPFRFDFVISAEVFEHIEPCRIEILFENIRDLMHDESIGVFNINLCRNKYHQSGHMTKDDWQSFLERYFDIIPEWTFNNDGQFKDHPYTRPCKEERERMTRQGVRFDYYRTFWWVRPRSAPFMVEFDKDIFLKTDYPVAIDSMDYIDPDGGATHYTDGKPFAEYLIKLFPEKTTLIDLGTASGSVPMTSRDAGLFAVGLDGSDASKNLNYHSWKLMPNIVRTCDVSRPFSVLSKAGHPFKFDFVTSWAMIEHVPKERLGVTFENIKKLMHHESLAILNIDLGESKWHPSGGLSAAHWQGVLKDHFEIQRDLTFDGTDIFRYHPYCHPDKGELETIKKLGLRFDSGRTFWWLKLK